ncbi:MAG: MMPL family transporter [Candidatus Heimdallarchaeota archaeon]|nr:MMPL family transporter [Candidatus Heimdallarchaeota archaeon]
MKKVIGKKNKQTNDENSLSKLQSQKGKPKKRTQAFFEWLGNFIVKRYKLILIIALISCAAAIYPAIKLQDELKYNDAEFLPQNIESKYGNALLDEQFPTNISRESTLIILDSINSISSEDNIEYIQTLTEKIYDHFDEQNDTAKIARIDSVLSVFEQYNASYWAGKDTIEELLYNLLISNVTSVHEQMYQIEAEFETLWNQIAGLYTMTWWNFSRTYYFGRYCTDLFLTGPADSIYESIYNYTNFSEGFGISPDYIDFVYNMIMNNLDNTSHINDQIVSGFAFQITNTTIYQELGHPENYTEVLYPQVVNYYNNWTAIFDSQFTNQNISVVNGTHLNENLYNFSSSQQIYLSQSFVLNNLTQINSTIFLDLDFKNLVIERIASSIAFTDFRSLAKEALGFNNNQLNQLENTVSSLIPSLLRRNYELDGPLTKSKIIEFSHNVTDQLMAIILEIDPPPQTIDDIPKMLSMWVLSEDSKSALITIQYDVHSFPTTSERELALQEADAWIGDLAHQLLDDLALHKTAEVYHTGEIYIQESLTTLSENDAKKIDIIAVVLVTVILIGIFCSLIAPLVPLVSIGISIAISFALLFWIAQAMDVHYLSTLILTVISMGAGVDYCIFLYSRYHEELEKGQNKEEAVKTAVKFAGESVFHSGLTVLVGFGALIIPDFPLIRIMGISMSIGIIFSIISALLVVPSLLMLLDQAVFWPKTLQTILRPQKWFKKKKKNEDSDNFLGSPPDPLSDESIIEGQSYYHKRTKNDNQLKTSAQKEGLTLRFGRFITRNGVIFFVISLVIFAPFVYFAVTMDTSTDFLSMLPEDFEAQEASDILDEKMAFGNPIAVKVLFYKTNASPLDPESLYQTERICLELLKRSHVKTIRTTVRPLGSLPVPYSNPEGLSYYREIISTFIGKDNQSFFMEIYLDLSPYSKEASNFVKMLPGFLNNKITSLNLTNLAGELYTTGVAREFYEMKMVTDNAYPIVIPVVIVGVYLILFFLFGSYFTPIRLILTIGMSIVFTLALLNLIFGIGLSAVLFWLLPIMLFSILMGLGLDYDIFLVTRIKEYAELGMSDKEAISHALEHTGTIITSCGLVMAAAFSSLLFSNLWHLRELGFAFTISILLDATFVRLVLVPSIMVLFERVNWLGPPQLQKIRRNPIVTEIMGTLGSYHGVTIYSKPLKEALEKVVETSLDESAAKEALLTRLISTIESSLGYTLNDSIRNALNQSLTKILSSLDSQDTLNQEFHDD